MLYEHGTLVLGKEQASICPNTVRAPERQGQRRTRVPVKTKRSMMKREESASPPGEAEGRYKGVRQRKWGRWVSEIRLPNSRERIWLGSYDSPKKAARAFDAAAVCLRGRHAARLNFPEAPPPRIPSSARPLTHQQIQAAAASHAYSSLPPPTPPLSFSSPPASVMADSVDIDAKEYCSFVESLQNFCGDFEIPTDDLAFDFFATAPEAEDESGNIDLGSESFLWSF